MIIKFIVFMCLLNNCAGAFELMILHASDINAEFEETPEEIGGFSRLLQYVHQKRNESVSGKGPPVLVLMTGNFFGTSIWYSVHRWRIVSDFLNLLKPDAIALGTREFIDGLDSLYQFLSALKCPVAGTNLVVSDKSPLKQLIQKSIIVHVQGKRIAVLGYTDRGYITNKNVDFLNIIQSIKDECDSLKKRTDIDYVVAIGHANLLVDRKIALNSDCVNVIVGSNAKMFMYTGIRPSTEKPSFTYPMMVDLSDGSQIPIVHSYINGKYMGELILNFGHNKQLTSATGNSIFLNNTIKQHPSSLALLEKYMEDLERKKRHIVAKTLSSLDGVSCNNFECTMGNVITDAFVDFKASQYSGLYWTNAAISVINSGAIRATQNITKQGKMVNEAFIYKSLPYQDQLITVAVTGATLFKILEHSMLKRGTSAFLQVAGLKVIYNKTVTPPEMEVLVRCAKCEVPTYDPLNESMTYEIVTTKYLGEGGDEYIMIINERVSYSPEVINSLQATMRYMQYSKKFIGQKEERLSIDEPQSSTLRNRCNLSLLLVMCIIALAQ